VPYLRLTADRRGFENTFLLHVPAPGEAPRVLYWYRTAPGLRIGRPALDDAAMRTLEAQYPDIDFDWGYILDMGAMTPVEVEAPVPPRRRKPQPPPPRATDEHGEDGPRDLSRGAPAATRPGPSAPSADDAAPAVPPPDRAETDPDSDFGPDLLAELLGRGIAASLRARHRDLAAAVAAHAWPDEAARQAAVDRVAAIDPDGWTTPDAVLNGMARIDAEVEAVERALR
jgi:hypothetical protein